MQPWIPENNHIPGNAYYENLAIQSANPDEDFITIGPKTILRNVTIHDKFGTVSPLVMRGKPNGPRSVTYLENAHDITMISTHWDGMSRYVSGGTQGVDSPVDVIRTIGMWSAGLFLEPHEKSYGCHIWPFDDARGIFIQHYDRSAPIEIWAEPGAEPQHGSISLLPKANVRSIHIQPKVPTDIDLQFVSTEKTAGAYIGVYQAGADYRGPIIHANMGVAPGTFNGLIFDVKNSGRDVFQVNSEGEILTGKTAARIAMLEARILDLEARLSGFQDPII